MLLQTDFEGRNFTLYQNNQLDVNTLIANQVYIAKGTRTFGKSTRVCLIVLTHIPSVNEIYISNTFTQPLFNREYFVAGRAEDTQGLDFLLDKLDFELELLEDLSLKTLTKYGEGTRV
jgi:hypothetical protein